MIKKIYQNKKILAVVIFLASLLASSAFLFFWQNVGPSDHAVPGTDYLFFYEPVAENILEGRGIVLNNELAVRYPPGYPVILSVIFFLANWLGVERFDLIVLFNLLMIAFSSSFLFLLAELIFNKKIALISSFLWLSYPLSLWFLKNPNTEPPFIFLFFLGLWLYILAIRKQSFKLFLVCGILIGLMSLIRPVSIFLPFLLIILTFFLIKELVFFRKILLALVLIGVYLATISPWLVYVFLETGTLIPLSTGGALSVAGGLTMMVDGVREDSLILLPDDVIALVNRSRSINRDSSLDAFIFLAKEMFGQPLAFFKLMVVKAARSWYATSEMWWEKPILLLQLPYLISAVLGVITAFKKFKEKNRYLMFFLAIIFYFWLTTVAALSIVRYLVPVMGLLMIFSALTLESIFNNLKTKYET